MKRGLIIYTVMITLFIAGCSTVRLETDIPASGPHESVFQGGSSLRRMDDLKAIHLAANHLRETGLEVVFEETLITLCEAYDTNAQFTGPDGGMIDYQGEYLAVTLYHSDHPEEEPCVEWMTVFIGEGGRILGTMTGTDAVKE